MTAWGSPTWTIWPSIRGGNLWCVSDITPTNLHNGFGEGAMPAPVTIDHRQTGNVANLVGVFGNNMLFTIPLNGHDAGALLPFAYGPVRCEMTGPTFVGDQLIISVQHPSEDVPIGTWQHAVARPRDA